jgi:3-methyladenine DNA glycosylase AlkD
VNNWDLVDSSAAGIVGRHLLDADLAPIYRLAESPHWWERRIAMVATHYFIRQKKFGATFELARRLLDDQHDLMHKAVGWMLREIGKRDLSALRDFLDANGDRLPRTALRYAIEKMDVEERRRYLAVKRRRSI